MSGKDAAVANAISGVQVAAVLDLAKKDAHVVQALSPEERANLVDLASTAPWAPGHLELIINALAPSEPHAARRPMQHFCPALLSYF